MPRRAPGSVRSAVILAEPHLLSEESARGYRNLLATVEPRVPIIIIPAVRQLSFGEAERLRDLAFGGARLILESGAAYAHSGEWRAQARVLDAVFGLNVREEITASTTEPAYLNYRCPERIMVRTFGAISPVHCSPGEQLAEHGGAPVAAKREVGQGCIVYLGSILGVGLLAQEREAHAVGAALLRG
jgi:hypothetical protein